ncbi:unnamed protein product [Rotaria sp. Silwood2]|nr:unnamed protein product [Rotaria sp. Silwood2]
MQLNFCAVIDETSSSPLSSSSSSVKVTISKTTTNKRKPMLIVNGYDFQIKSYNKTKTIKFWRCSNRNCGVLLHTNLNDEFVRFSGNMTDHSHIPNPAALEIRTLREQMRQRAENELLPLQEIAEQEVRKGLLTGEALAVLPNILNLGHNLIQNRRKLMPPLPQSCSFSISDEYKNDYLNCDRLLLHDSYDPPFQIDESLYTRPEGRILVWSSDVQLKLMFDSEKLYMDGTFSTAPPNFDQLILEYVLLKDQTCTFEEVQDRARALLDGLIEKYSIVVQEQNGLTDPHPIIGILIMSSSLKEFEQAFMFVRNLPYKMPVSIGCGGFHKILGLLLIVYKNLNDLPSHKLLRILFDQCGMKKS